MEFSRGIFMKQVKIAGRQIGQGCPCFIVAEAGVNHNGRLSLAKKLVDVAKEAGADAVKFQTFKAESIVTQEAPRAKYQRETTGGGSQYKMLKEFELTAAEFKCLAEYAKKKRIIFLSTPYDEASVDLLDELVVPAFKISSCDLTNLPLLKHVAKKRKPIILSTGMATLGEIREAVNTVRRAGNKNIILLQCTSGYPVDAKELNLRAIQTLSRIFKVPVGFSDHTIDIYPAVAAATLGASVVEKHFTLDKKLPGPDHRMSLEPAELREMVRGIRCAETALGSSRKEPARCERELRKLMRKSIVAKVDIPKRASITNDMLTVKRPGTGVEPKYLAKIIGYKARKDIKKDEVISWSKVEKS